MSRNDFLGEFEQIVLLTVARLGDEGYGMAIRQEIEDRVQRPVAIGSVYAALDRMERKALPTPSPERPKSGAKRKKSGPKLTSCLNVAS